LEMKCSHTFVKDFTFKFNECQEFAKDWAEFAGYTLHEYLVRISLPDGMPYRYGVLVDIEDGDERHDLVTQKPGGKTFVKLGDAYDEPTRKRIEERFQVFGEPYRGINFSRGRPWSHMVLIQIPTSKYGTDAEILAEQEQIIRDYIKAMRQRWKKHFDALEGLGEDFKAEFTKHHYRLASIGAPARWEVLRSFFTRTILRQAAFRDSEYLTLIEWMFDRQDDPLEKDEYLQILGRLRMPLYEGESLRIEVDWALPYIATYWHSMEHSFLNGGEGELKVAYLLELDDDGSETTIDFSSQGPPEAFMPFHNFRRPLSRATGFTVPQANEKGVSIGIGCTGYVPYAVMMHLIAQIDFLWGKNYLETRHYQAYIQRLGLIRGVLRGHPLPGDPDNKPLGPFAEMSEEDFTFELVEANKEDNPLRKKWVKEGTFNVAEGVKEHLLLGIRDIDQLMAFFQSVSNEELTNKVGINGLRNLWLEKLQKWLGDFYLRDVWDDFHTDVFSLNLDEFFGSPLYDLMILTVLGHSVSAKQVCEKRLRPRIYEHPDLSKPADEYQKRVWNEGLSALTKPANWYLINDGVLIFAYELYLNAYLTKSRQSLNNLLASHKAATHYTTVRPMQAIYKLMERYHDPAAINKFGKNLRDEMRRLAVLAEASKTSYCGPNILRINIDAQKAVIAEIKRFNTNEHLRRGAATNFGRVVTCASSLASLYSIMVIADSFEGELKDWVNVGATVVGVADVSAMVAETILKANLNSGIQPIMAMTRSTQMKALNLLSRIGPRICVAAGFVGVGMGIYGSIQSVQRDDTGVAVTEVVGTSATSAYIGGYTAYTLLGVKSAAFLFTGPVGWILLAIMIGSSILVVWQPWKTGAQKFCKDYLLVETVENGGMDRFERFKDDFKYDDGEGGSTRIVKYDIGKHGNPEEIAQLVYRFEKFINDGDTFDNYE